MIHLFSDYFVTSYTILAMGWNHFWRYILLILFTLTLNKTIYFFLSLSKLMTKLNLSAVFHRNGFYVNVLLQRVYLQIKSWCWLWRFPGLKHIDWKSFSYSIIFEYEKRFCSFLKRTRIESEYVLDKCRNA